jgi:hypothetical protein
VVNSQPFGICITIPANEVGISSGGAELGGRNGEDGGADGEVVGELVVDGSPARLAATGIDDGADPAPADAAAVEPVRAVAESPPPEHAASPTSALIAKSVASRLRHRSRSR